MLRRIENLRHFSIECTMGSTIAGLQILLPASIYFVTVIGIAAQRCPSSTPDLVLRSGSVSFDKYSVKTSWCRWLLPTYKAANHVTLLKLTSISLRGSNNRCQGSFSPPDVRSFCDKPANSCFIYVSFPTCNHEMAIELLRNESCTESHWILTNTTARYVRFYTYVSTRNSFSFDYRYFSCQEYLNKTQKVDSKKEKHKETSPSGISPGTVAGVLVFLLLLLCASLAALFLLYRRHKELKDVSKPPRVQYELTRPRDITVPANAASTINHASRESHFALHGRHQDSDLQQHDAASYRGAQVESSYSYIVDVNQDCNSFTSDESNVTPVNDAACAYAVVSKQKATATNSTET